jgi:spermidine synthase
VQLATPDALYSDGNNYKPVSAAISHLNPFMPGISQVLALGTGLGSLVHITRAKGYNPHFTLVEIDKVVLNWAIEFMDAKNASNITPVSMDAQLFMEQNTLKYGLIFIDIFNSRSVPPFVTTAAFLTLCRHSLADQGYVAFNYMIDNPEDWVRVQEVFASIFPNNTILDLGINRVFIGSL